MQCQSCKKYTATIHLTEISNGQRMETHLCESCAQEQGLAVKSQIPLNELLSNLLAVQLDSDAESSELDDTATDTKACPSCGMTLKQFRKTSLLGCGNDYEVFDSLLGSVIEKAHGGNTEHRGKIPSKAPRDMKEQAELINLRRQLEEAVKAEDYETAAELRDKIERLQ